MKRVAVAATVAAAFSAGLMVQPGPQMAPNWVAAHVISVHDGDTFSAAVDLGFGTTIVEDFRLLGVDTPELQGETKVAAERARDWVTAQATGRPILIREHGRDKWGRWLAEVQVGGRDLSQELIRRGMGKPYFGGKKE